LIVPGAVFFNGSSALINLQEADVDTMVVAPVVAQHIGFDFDRDGRDGDRGYPNSLMGAIALIRQSFLDASWYQSGQEPTTKIRQDRAPRKTEREPGRAGGADGNGTRGLRTEDELRSLARVADRGRV